MNHNSDFESGGFLDLECSQTFKPSQTLANFLETTEAELQTEQTSTPVTKTAKVGIKRNMNQVQQNLELRCTKKMKQTNSSSNLKNSSAPQTTTETVTQTELSKGEQRRQTMLELPMVKLLSWVKMNIGKNLRDSEIFFRIDENNFQFDDGIGRTNFLPNNNHSTDDDCFNAKTTTGHITPEKVDELYTGDSDDDVGNGNDNIPTTNTSVYKAIDEFKTESKNIIQRAADQLVGYDWGGNVCYVSDVVVPPGRSGVIRFVDDICRYIQFYRTQPFVIVSEHDDHVHIAHACVQANQTCRCAWLQRCSDYRKYRRKHLRGRVYACNLGGSDWAAVVRYFCTNGRIAKKVHLPGADEGICDQIRNLSKEQDPVYSKEGLVEACIDEGSWDIFGRKSALRRGNEGSRGHIGRRVQTAKSENGNDNDGTFPVTINELLKYYPTCPPDAFINIKEFYLNPILNKYDETDRNVRLQLRNWCNVIRDWDLYDFNTYYHTSGVKPYFNAYSRTSVSVYYSVEKSLIIANELLRYQFENNEKEIKQFLNTLYNVLDKKIPKLNSICVYSPPSAGKNFFFDAVASYFLNYGMFGTANKNNNFTWADGAGKRLVIWNEPNYEQAHIEKMKELLGGDTTRVHLIGKL
ncbi:hypothetical protein AGLY_011568 [Aphis glycines]|uniref:Parvovirus non-structural protein 1 helicase domain-containing protein n=1 Tax=Aphis glycines TaxID=307491 RepID=A0A6G0TE17_APHGL|nr:hypothetical protein AGLY_011568 [Aphis glycines]